MSYTANLRRQHDESIFRIKEIFTYLIPEYLKANAQQVRNLLSTFIGKANIHRATEDEYLYPKLLKHESPELRNLAQKYYDGFISSKDVLGNYSTKWAAFSKIKENPNEFIDDTKMVLTKILDRIDKENNELFTLVDKLM
ncbi:hemerythrin domain-containing protein [Desulfosporosinus sp. SYSU MS00001]|uniref:hemerythrin domain-containing protein n=1 Tax=Desulfosporosinus sp. SYSU MS00001 TaxID=3416284 RepID=UPI003CFB8A43